MLLKQIQSWTGVFKIKAAVIDCNSHRDIYKALKYPSKVIGSLHSYNQMPLAPRVIKLGSYFDYTILLTNNPGNHLVQVGASTKIKDLMNYLVKHDLRLKNSGNHREQTIAGALIGGTHGFGKNAPMADSVTSFQGVWRNRDNSLDYRMSTNASDLRRPDLLCVTEVTIEVVPCTSYKVDNCVCRLSKIEPHSTDTARAYAVLPFSGKDPVVTVADYTPVTDTPAYKIKRVKKKSLPWKWWRLKIWWALDRFVPPIRRVVQRALGLINMKPFTLYTHRHDIDALYDPFPGPDGPEGNLKFTRWAYRPTYTCYNISIFVRPEDVKNVIKYAIYESDQIRWSLLRCFIGVRELSDTSKVSFAGNFEGPVSAIDFYCTPKHADDLIWLQRKIQNRFWTRPHYGKTVLSHSEVLGV